MKKISSYLLISSVLAIIIAGVINYYFVKEHNNKIVNDSLAKARKVKKEKAEKRKEEERSGDVNFSPGKNKNFSPGENKDFSPGENKELEIIKSKIKN